MTDVTVASQHSKTHLGTILPELSMNGKLLSPLFLCRKELEDVGVFLSFAKWQYGPL